MAGKDEEKYIGTRIPKVLWKRWKMSLLKRGKTQDQALLELVEDSVEAVETENGDDEQQQE